MATGPLFRYRVPNPPFAFSGRERDVTTAHTQLKEHRVLILSGPEGIGKTALAHKILSSRDDALCIPLREKDDPRNHTVRALTISGEIDQTPELALKLAEEQSRILLLDGLSFRENKEEIIEWLKLFASYAKRSALLITTRNGDESQPWGFPSIVLSPLPEDTLFLIAKKLAPQEKNSTYHRWIQLSFGIPARLIRCIHEKALGSFPETKSKSTKRFLRILRTANKNVPLESLKKVFPIENQVLEELVHEGLILRTSRGVCIHPSLMVLPTLPNKETYELGCASLDEKHPASVLLGLSLLQRTIQNDVDEERIVRAAEDILRAGYSESLFHVLTRYRIYPKLWSVWARSALGTRNQSFLAQIHAPFDDQIDHEIEWLIIQHALGHFEQSQALAEKLLSQAPKKHFETIQLIYGQATMARGQYQKAIDFFDKLSSYSTKMVFRFICQVAQTQTPSSAKETLLATTENLGLLFLRYLQDDLPLNEVDTQILPLLQKISSSAIKSESWSILENEHQVQLGAQLIDFSRRHVLWKLLCALSKADPTISKERLVYDVWNVKQYHPLRHDNRLHSAIRKLRNLIEKDPKKPQRILTRGDGYFLRGLIPSSSPS